MTAKIFQAQDAYIAAKRVDLLSADSADDEVRVLTLQQTYPNKKSLLIKTDEKPSDASQSLLTRDTWHIDPSYIAHLPRGIIIDGYIPTNVSGILYHDLATHAGRHVLPPFVRTNSDGSKFATLSCADPIENDHSAAVLFFSPACGHNHSHWLLQTLPKLQMFQDAGINPNYYLVSSTIQNYQRNTLKALGISDDQILVMHSGQSIQFRNLYVAYTGNDLYPNLRIYDELVSEVEATQPGPEKIYISRKDARGMRRFLNEDDMISCAIKNGFTIITPSTLTFEDEVNLFRHARVIAGPIGAGLYNGLFTKSGATIIAMSDPAYVMDWPLQMASLKGHNIIHLLGNSFLSFEEIHRGTHNSWVLDPQHFQDALDLYC